MEYYILKRDRKTRLRRHDNLMSPTVGNNILHLARYAVTEDRLIEVRRQLSDANCIIDKLEISRVHFNN